MIRTPRARMLFESPHLRVDAVDGVGTLWLGFPGDPVNALNPARLRELDRALAAVLPNPHLDALVIRSALPGGFCGGYVPGTLAAITGDEDAAAFARTGQRVLDRLAAADCVTLAYLEGPCLGPGLELALACDYRLAVADPDGWFGFPDGFGGGCWGGATRLGRLGVRGGKRLTAGGWLSPWTAREAHRAGLVDDACCRRRAKIELRTWLDRIQANPRKPQRSGPADAAGLTAEQWTFRDALRSLPREDRESACPTTPSGVPSPPAFPGVVAITAVDRVVADVAVEAAVRGSGVICIGSDAALGASWSAVAGRGRVTPLELAQARARLTVADGPTAVGAAGLVVVDPRAGVRPPAFVPHLRPTAVLAVLNGPAPAHPRAVGVDLPASVRAVIHPGQHTGPDAVAALLAWLPRLGYRYNAVTPAANTAVAPPRAAA